MAVDQIEPVVRDFVVDGSNEVLVLKGNWGVGKTHFWHRLIEEQSEKGNVGKEKYSYISLFGVNSLDGLKRSIFTSVVDSSNIQDGGVFSALRDFADKAESIPKVADWSGGAVIEKVLFDGVEDTLVCIDDLERRGEDLKMRDLLGLASMMKEERSCQVVLILNDDALADEVRIEFGTYGEKLVDLEVEFERSPGDAFECVFDDSDKFSDILGDCVRRLEIRNVRIIQRLKRLTEKLEPYLDECESQTRIAALETLAILVWSYYGEKSRSPSIEDLKGAVYAGLTEEEGEWDQLIRDYGYGSFGDLDEVLLGLIEKGYLTQEELQQQIDKIDEQARANEANRKLTEAWKLYHDSFRNNEGEFVEELIQAVENAIGYISVVSR
jgi:hypothetical protein